MAVSKRLQQMGIQQWRLKPSVNEAPSEADFDASSSAAMNAESIPNLIESQAPPAPATLAPSSAIAPQTVPAIQPPAPPIDPLADMGWQELQALIEDDQHCPSCGAQKSILGSGNLKADWVFITDAPTQREIDQHEMFAGRAGQLFDAILASIGLVRSQVYSSSVFKCVAGDDLSVTPQCKQIVHRQIALIEPKVVVTLGEFAAQAIVRANEDLSELRAAEQKCHQSKVAIVPSFSLNEMLNEPTLKAYVWQDLKRCLRILQDQ